MPRLTIPTRRAYRSLIAHLESRASALADDGLGDSVESSDIWDALGWLDDYAGIQSMRPGGLMWPATMLLDDARVARQISISLAALGESDGPVIRAL
jgi:hypothetical protein